MTAPTRDRAWAKRVAAGAVAVALAGGGWLYLHGPERGAARSAGRLRAADTDEARAAAAAELVALGDAGLPQVLAVLRSDDAAGCGAVVAALRDAGKVDPVTAARCGSILADAGSFTDEGKDALLPLACDAVKSPDVEFAAKGRAAVRAGLGATSPDVVARAVTVAAFPDVNLKAEVVPHLAHERAEVRRAAVAAVGPAGQGAAAVGDEELFRLLNDPDLEVRAVCEGALVTRGLDGDQIAAAKKLTHPDAGERLKLLLDLRWGRDTLRDPGPWLERLSRDADPAVRAGAARVAVECRLTYAGWLDRLAAEDQDPTVRAVAGFHRGAAAEVRPAGFTDR